ncbi:MAG: AAA family ATPase [Dongiaceae bacterium]
MFCDLVGSTALAARLDPEDLGEVMAAYQGCVAAAVAPFGGFVAKYLGDGALVYFGYPRAEEDDAERAVRAGLALAAAVRGLRLPATEDALQARIGIATGLVVVGDLILAGEGPERGVVGETPNLAARLQAAAAPDGVVIADATRRLVGGLFACRDLGPLAVKGIAAPVRAWQVLGESGVASRFEALHAAALAPLVGRAAELELLLRRWAEARRGDGRLVLLAAEPGLGKSRLVAALQERLGGAPHRLLRYFCSPRHRDSPLQPVIAELEQAAGFAGGDAPDERRRKLAALLREREASAPEAALIAELLSLPVAGEGAALDKAARRRALLDAILAQVERAARGAPLLLVVEDAHWLDPSTLELLQRLVERLAGLPLLLLVTFRPEFAAPWIGQPRTTLMTLARLDPAAAADLARRTAGAQPLAERAVAAIVARTDGVPLFVEELTKAMLESGAGAAGPEAQAAVPATLQASLMMRLDRLSPAARATAQGCALLGREFSWELAAAVSTLPEAALRTALDELVRSGLLLPGFAFKHALVQDAAAASLLRKRRRQLHARIAAALAQRFPESAANAPEVIGQHHAEAGAPAAAGGCFLAAGWRAAARSSNAEAVAHFDRVLALAEALPTGAERDRLALAAQSGIAAVRMASHGYGARQTVDAFAAARGLAQRIGDRTAQFKALFGLYTNHYIRASHRRALHDTVQALRLAEVEGDPAMRCVAHRAHAAVLNACGRFAEAGDHAARAWALYRPDEHARLAAEYGHDLGVAALAHIAIAAWHRGEPAAAAVATRQALDLADAVAHANSAAYCQFFPAGLLAAVARDLPGLAQAAERLEALGGQHGLAQWSALGLALRGCLAAGRGAPDAVAAMRGGLAACRAVGFELYRPLFLGYLAEAWRAAGEPDQAAAALRQALGRVERTGGRAEEPELRRLAGGLALAAGSGDGEAQLQQAMALAAGLPAPLIALRATADLARHWRAQGRVAEARALLAARLEGLAGDAPDLRDARALLAALGSDPP